jgi:hypothetical protein
MILTEKQQRNRLRKKELEQNPSIDHDRRDSLRKYTKLLERKSFKIFVDDLVDPEQYFYIEHISMDAVIQVEKFFKDNNLPMTKIKVPIIFTDISKNPFAKKQKNLKGAAAYYYNKAIYMDQFSVDKYYYWIHEYAHYMSYRIPKRFVEYATQEYEKMLTEYFKVYVGKKTKRKSLESSYYDNPHHREMMAEKLGLPSPYSATNMDEFFAEMIALWPKIPNNKLTYRLKKVVRQILQRF